MMLRACLLGLLIASSTLPARAGEKLTIRVSPAVAFAPANLVVRATIEADAQNRAVEIVAESNEFYRSSEVQLDGENAPRTNSFEFRSLPSGNYEVKATLFNQSGSSIAKARAQVSVISNGRDSR